MKHLCIWLIRLYQKYLSPLKRRPTCRFEPTCSAYAVQAYQKRGFFVGSVLTAYRILRCNPFCPGGYDPVPEHGFTTGAQLARAGSRYYPLDDDTTEEIEEETSPEDLENQDAPAAEGKPSDRGDHAAEQESPPCDSEL